jgi:hypothetical protein
MNHFGDTVKDSFGCCASLADRVCRLDNSEPESYAQRVDAKRFRRRSLLVKNFRIH